MRIPLATDYKTRTAAPDKDARLQNCVIHHDKILGVRKRPGLANEIAVGTGQAQGGIGIDNQIFVITGDQIYPEGTTCNPEFSEFDANYLASYGGITYVPTLDETWIGGTQNLPVQQCVLRISSAGAVIGIIANDDFLGERMRYDATTDRVVSTVLNHSSLAVFSCASQAFERYIPCGYAENIFYDLDGAGNIIYVDGLSPLSSLKRTSIMTGTTTTLADLTAYNPWWLHQDKNGSIWFIDVNVTLPEQYLYEVRLGGVIVPHNRGVYEHILGTSNFVYDSVRHCLWFQSEVNPSSGYPNGLYKYDIATEVITVYSLYDDYPPALYDNQVGFDYRNTNGLEISAADGLICMFGVLGASDAYGVYWFDIATGHFKFCINPLIPNDPLGGYLFAENMSYLSGKTTRMIAADTYLTNYGLIKQTKPRGTL